MDKQKIEELSLAFNLTTSDMNNIVRDIEAEFRTEVYKALCFLCRDEGEPEERATIWFHLHRGNDGKVYSRTECKCSQLRAFYKLRD